MELIEIPAVWIVIGIAASAVLTGADFGAPFWALTARGAEADRIRESGQRSMAPVWEANHVWLMLVLFVCWVAYPEIVDAIFSTLWMPLMLACLGLIMRAVGYVAVGSSSRPAVAWVTALASLLVPFALGTVIGAIVDGRVPADGGGDAVSSWLAPLPVMVGLLFAASSIYLAAVYLAADADRRGEVDLAAAFRGRGVVAGLVTGAIGLAGLVTLYFESREFFDAMMWPGAPGSDLGRFCVFASAIAGTATLWLLSSGRYGPARYLAAAAVISIVAGWGIAQGSEILPGLTLEEAAASDQTITVLLIGLAIGVTGMITAMVLLYRKVLRGRYDPADKTD